MMLDSSLPRRIPPLIDDDDILSIDQIASLMRLYLEWPNQVEKSGDAEAGWVQNLTLTSLRKLVMGWAV